MNSSKSEAHWIWHPGWIDKSDGSAGGFVHFRKSLTLKTLPLKARIQISADTRYKLYINSRLVSIGPVKGDERLWFYDELDIQPYLRAGVNHIGVRVLRFYHATSCAITFSRLPYAGLLIRNVDQAEEVNFPIQTDQTWQAAIDFSTRLPTNLAEDDFLHIYEDVRNDLKPDLTWVSAKQLAFPSSHGITAPWKLSNRLIPPSRFQPTRFKAIHNIRSTQSPATWASSILNSTKGTRIRLPAGSSHHLELEAEYHITALMYFRFERPAHAGSTMKVTYSECYEDTPRQIPYLRCKGDRCDSTKQLMGPEDKYTFGGMARSSNWEGFQYYENEDKQEIFAPFCHRTLRFIALDIDVSQECDLVMEGIDLVAVTYPLDVIAEFNVPPAMDKTDCRSLWTTSIRTLQNCMHDGYEDCPFYEQLQYAMDTRSSALFTYCVSGDDRLARQAIIQIHNSYNPKLGLTGSRAPSHQPQIIPHFSLFWICMVTDHFEYFGDAQFVRQFTPEWDGVFEFFARRVDPLVGLVRSFEDSSYWDFVDWAEEWRPMGIPPAGYRTGFQSYTNMLYAYSLRRAADVLIGIGRSALANEYQSRANSIVQALRTHCFDGEFFTDGLASKVDATKDFSQHSQIWAILCGAATGNLAHQLLSQCLQPSSSGSQSSQTNTNGTHHQYFTPSSISMSFYTLRALSLAGKDLYNTLFHSFWAPWRTQLAQNLTTWCEDSVSLRSDCHAWGSAPLYEFTAEVAGIRPAAPGWAIVAFEPRVDLFAEVDAKVPFGGSEQLEAGIAHVKWKRDDSSGGGKVRVELSLRLLRAEQRPDVPVKVTLPDGKVQVRSGLEDIVLVLES